MRLKMWTRLALGCSALALHAAPALADATPECNVGPGAFSTECGVDSEARALGSTAVGNAAMVNSSAARGSAIGTNAQVSQENGTALGVGSRVNTVGIGTIPLLAVPDEIGGTALGAYSRTQGDDSVAVGGFSVVGGRGLDFTQINQGTAIGAGTNVAADGGTALGARATTSGQNSVAIGANSAATEDDTVSFGTVGNERRLTNIASGIADTDGVNVAQLRGVETQAVAAQSTANSAVAAAAVAGAAADVAMTRTTSIGQATSTMFGGGAAYNAATGAFSAPDYNVRGATYNDVGSALEALDDGLSQLETRFDMIALGNNKANQQAVGGIAAAMAFGGTMVVPDSNVSLSLNLATYRGEQGYSGAVVMRVTPRVYVNGGFAGSTVKGSNGGRVGVAIGF